MNKTIIALIIALAISIFFIGHSQLSNKSDNNVRAKIDTVIQVELRLDTIYNNLIKFKHDSFVTYVNHRDTILLNTTKVDSVLATKIDTSKDIRISAIQLRDSLSVCEDDLRLASDEILHKDTVLAKIDTIVNSKQSSNIPWKTYGAVAAGGVAIGILL